MRKSNQSKGSVFVETVFSIPFLVTTAILLMEVGKSFVQSVWISQTGYQIAALGAESTEQEREQQMTTLEETHKGLHSEKWRKSAVPNISFSYSVTGAKRLEIDIAADVQSDDPTRALMPLRFSLDTPVFSNSANVPSYLQEFQNPSGSAYDCCGYKTASTPVSCITCTSATSCSYVICS